MQSTFIARTMRWRGSFMQRARLRKQLTAIWQQMQQDGLLASQHLYRRMLSMNASTSRSAWNVLSLIELPEGASPQEFLTQEQVRIKQQTGHDQAPMLADLFRVEVLEPTPGCYFPHPSGAWNAGNPLFSVEYIEVPEQNLDAYRMLMTDASGPAMRQLVEQGAIHSFIPLETREVLHACSETTRWNQIHLVGMRWTGPLRFMNQYGQALQRLQRPRKVEELTEQFGQISSYARMDLARR